ncbi:MAG: NYN domain-containing protein [Bacteroidota bacterium]
MSFKNNKLVRVGVFYDGNYLYHVSNYYYYFHERKSRISIAGIHHFIKQKVAELLGEGISSRHCQIVDSHYFRGRLNAREASQKGNLLYYDRVFDDILMAENVTTHYLPVKTVQGHKEEKGIDVWLALEAYELTAYKNYDVLVLIAGDGDYVPLVRKVNTLGTSVMLLSWDFEYTDDYGIARKTRTSQDLLEQVTFPISMHEVIENRLEKDKFMINNLFVPHSPYHNNNTNNGSGGHSKDLDREPKHYEKDQTHHESDIFSIKDGYGFIKYPPNNLFFHYDSVVNADFEELQPYDKVRFRITKNERGEDIATDVELIDF